MDINLTKSSRKERYFIIYSYLIISTDQNHKCDPSLQHSKAVNEGNDAYSSSLGLMTQKHRLQLIGRQPMDRFSNVSIKSKKLVYAGQYNIQNAWVLSYSASKELGQLLKDGKLNAPPATPRSRWWPVGGCGAGRASYPRASLPTGSSPPVVGCSSRLVVIVVWRRHQ